MFVTSVLESSNLALRVVGLLRLGLSRSRLIYMGLEAALYTGKLFKEYVAGGFYDVRMAKACKMMAGQRTKHMLRF